MSNICIIPARGGSKRIPRKNIKEFLAKPIIAYSIESALKSGLFDEVMVSTDDKEIAEIAIKHGAKVPFFRSDKNSDDFATTYDVIEEVIEKYKTENKSFENICCIYSCAPFVTKSKLVAAHEVLVNNKFDTVFPVMEFSFPIQRALRTNGDKIEMIDDRFLNTRSQDLEKSYHDVGQFYWMNTKKVFLEKKIVTANCGYIIVPEIEGQDIDTLSDWELAEIKYKLINK